MEVAKLNPEEHFILRQKQLSVEDIFSVAKQDWESASRTSFTKLRAILMQLLAQNNIIDKLTDWAKNVVFSMGKGGLPRHFHRLRFCGVVWHFC